MTLRPPYQRLRAAETRMAREHPNATCVKAIWTPGSSNSDVCVEVWENGHATVVPA